MTRYKKELKSFKSLSAEDKKIKTNRVLAAFAWLDFVVFCKKQDWAKTNKAGAI